MCTKLKKKAANLLALRDNSLTKTAAATPESETDIIKAQASESKVLEMEKSVSKEKPSLTHTTELPDKIRLVDAPKMFGIEAGDEKALLDKAETYGYKVRTDARGKILNFVKTCTYSADVTDKQRKAEKGKPIKGNVVIRKHIDEASDVKDAKGLDTKVVDLSVLISEAKALGVSEKSMVKPTESKLKKLIDEAKLAAAEKKNTLTQPKPTTEPVPTEKAAPVEKTEPVESKVTPTSPIKKLAKKKPGADESGDISND